MTNPNKKPRLFYYDYGVNAFLPAPKTKEVDQIVQLDSLNYDGCMETITFKRIDMADSEFEDMPEAGPCTVIGND